MSNIKDFLSSSSINLDSLTKKKQQTDYKIKYVSEYVKQWAIISSEREDITDITFIDCMCNAGVYHDGDLCTAMEVMLIFNDLAIQHPEKKYNIYLNDYDKQKIEVLKAVKEHLRNDNVKNVRFNIMNTDVNVYLDKIYESKHIFGFGKSVVLYVDPYNFGTVHIDKIHKVMSKHYCELIFNFFISDYVRNWKKDKERIFTCLGGKVVNSKEELIEYITNQFHVGYIKYKFSYQFKTQTNIELYQIMFFTPSKKGLEVLKDTLWTVFNGEFFYRNKTQDDDGQINLFSKEDEKKWLLALHSEEARNLLCEKQGEIMTYSQIEVLLIEKSILKESQILKNVIKPLIKEGKITKMNRVPIKSNYKDDSYKIGDVK